MKYWLLKTEPDTFSIDDLAAQPNQTTGWDGVRNYQARNMLRDDFAVGDQVLLYHSNAAPPCIVGTATVTRKGYPDLTALDPDNDHFDPKSATENPRWFQVDIRFASKFETPIPLEQLRSDPKLIGMVLLQKGSRLSVQPVTQPQFKHILSIAKGRRAAK